MTSVVRLTCLAALVLGACTPKSSGNAGPSFVDSGARDLRADRGNDAGADDTAATDTGPDSDATGDAAAPDAPADVPVTSDAPADTSAPSDTATPDARDSAGDPTLNLDLPALDLRDALTIDLGADARDGGADARDGGG